MHDRSNSPQRQAGSHSESSPGDGIDRAENDAAVAEALNGGGAIVGPASAVRSVPRVDPSTGEVSGTGSGTGGGNAGEDHDDDHTAGSNTTK